MKEQKNHQRPKKSFWFVPREDHRLPPQLRLRMLPEFTWKAVVLLCVMMVLLSIGIRSCIVHHNRREFANRILNNVEQQQRLMDQSMDAQDRAIEQDAARIERAFHQSSDAFDKTLKESRQHFDEAMRHVEQPQKPSTPGKANKPTPQSKALSDFDKRIQSIEQKVGHG